MHVFIISLGTAGDVVPLTGLAARIKAAGHEVAIASEGRLASLADGLGVGFHPLPTPAEASGEPAPSSREGILSTIREQGDQLEAAVRHGADADLVLLSSSATPLGWHVVEAMEVASMGVFLQPYHPTRELCPVFTSRPSWGSWGNRAGMWAMLCSFDLLFSRTAKAMRLRLGLPRASSRALRRRLERRRWPVCYGFSPVVVPRPADWRAGLEVVGYWWPPPRPGWRPSPELVDFLEAGPPPVLVGFGSTEAGSRGGAAADRLSEVAGAALRRAGVRGVIQSGWAGLSVVDDDVITVGEVSHEWLMPRTAAVVHHAGAGTTAAGLRAGIPAIPVPRYRDQPFWARRLVALGVSPGQLSFRELSTDDLGEAICQAVSDPSYRARAAAIAARLQSEDGAGRVVEIVDRYREASHR